MINRKILFITFYTIFIILAGCGSMDIYNSKWTDTPPELDGNNDEWRGKIFYLQDKQIIVGFQNDSNYLYLVLMTSDQSSKFQILGRGLTVWLDKAGGKDKNFGIQFPVKNFEPGMNPQFKRGDDSTDFLKEMLKNDLEDKEVQLFGPSENDKQIVNFEDAKGFSVNISISNYDVLVYEMKVPLNKNIYNSLNLGVNSSSTIGIGVETPEMDFSKIGSNENNEGRGDMSHRGHGGPGMRGNGNQRSRPEPLKYWCQVNLTPNNTVSGSNK